MIRRSLFTFTPILFLLVQACGGGQGSPDKAQMIKNIDSLRSIVQKKSAEGELPKKEMRSLLESYKRYVEHHPKDSLAPQQLFRAGSVARSLREPQKALNLFNRILSEYPDFNKEPTVRFLIAFIYDQDLEKREKAKDLYQAVIDSFPDHRLAKDAEQYLKVIDLSDDELIDRFEERKEMTDSVRTDSAKKAS